MRTDGFLDFIHRQEIENNLDNTTFRELDLLSFSPEDGSR